MLTKDDAIRIELLIRKIRAEVESDEVRQNVQFLCQHIRIILSKVLVASSTIDPGRIDFGDLTL